MRVLVTGAAGFIGSHVSDALVDRGHTVVGLDSLDPQVHSGPPAYLNPEATYVFEDLRQWEPDAQESFDAIVHLAALGGVARAAREPADVIGANAFGTARLLELARGWGSLSRVVLAGSFSVYGANYSYRVPSTGRTIGAERRREDLDNGLYEVRCPDTGEEAVIQPITTSATLHPLETYGASKYMQELCLLGFEGCPATVLRFSSVYGSRMRWRDSEATIIAKIAGWIANDERPRLFEDGRQIRDWVWVGDVVEALVRAVEDGAPPLVNVCSGSPTTLEEACRLVSQAMAKDLEPEIAGGYRVGDMRHCLGDARAFAELIGRRPLPFERGAAYLLDSPPE